MHTIPSLCRHTCSGQDCILPENQNEIQSIVIFIVQCTSMETKGSTARYATQTF